MIALTRPELAMLHAVAGGRAEMTCSREPDLWVDGRGVCDQFGAHHLGELGLICPAVVVLASRVPAELTAYGRDVLAGLR